MTEEKVVPAPEAAAVNVSALESLLRVKATPEEREAVLHEIAVNCGVKPDSYACNLRTALAAANLVMSLAEYYAERLAVTPERARKELQLEMGKTTAQIVNIYIFGDGSELMINRDGEYEVIYGAYGVKSVAA